MAGGGSSSSKSTPKDFTPEAFKRLQGPLANVFASLLGAGQEGSAFGQNFGLSGTAGAGTNASSRTQSDLFVRPDGTVTTTRGATNPFAMLALGPDSPFSSANRPLSTGSAGASSRASARAGAQGGAGGSTGGEDPLAGIPGFEGPLTADITPNEQATLDLLQRLTSGGGAGGGDDLAARLRELGNFQSGQTAGGDRGTLGEFNQEFLDAIQLEENPFLQAAIEAAQRPTLQGLTETLTRDLPGRFTQAGQFVQPGGSSAFDRAAAIATRGVGDAIGDIATNLSFQTFESERGRQFDALGREVDRRFTGEQQDLDRAQRERQLEAETGLEATRQLADLSQQEVDNAVKNLQAQALPRLIEEFGIERGIEQFNNRLNSLLVLLQTVGGVTQPVIANESTQSSRTKPNLLGAL